MAGGGWHVWQGVVCDGGVHGGGGGAWQGGVHGGGHVCWQGGMRANMVSMHGGRGWHAWWPVGGGGVNGIRRDTVNERAVRILLECILVLTMVIP